MTSHILSWGGNELGPSPVLPSRASIVSIDAILPNLNTRDLDSESSASRASTLEVEIKESDDSAIEKAKRGGYAYTWVKVEAKAKKEEERGRLDRTRETQMAASSSQAAKQAEGRATVSATSSSQNPAFCKMIDEAAEVAMAEMNVADSVTRITSPSPSTDPRGSSVAPPAKSPRKTSASPRSESRNVGGFSGPVRRSLVANLVSRGPASSISTTSATATAWSTGKMSLASLLSHGLNLNKGKREGHRAAESQAKPAINPMEVEFKTVRSRTPTSTYARALDSYLRHEKYFFKDGNITFLVEGTLYCIHRYFFSRDSDYFSTRFSQLTIRDHEALPTIISLGDIERKDFEAFLSVIYPENFEKHDLSYKEWVSVLQLSTRWGFASLRKLALASIKPPTPHDQLLLARNYSIDHWILPALSALCERTAPLSLDEAREMKIEDVVVVAMVRESIRDQTVPVDAAEIALRVEAAQAGKLSSAQGVDDLLTRPGIPNSCHVDDLDGSICPATFPFKGVNVPSVNSEIEVSEQGIDLRMDASSSSVTEAVDGNTIAPPVDPGLTVRADDDVENLAKEDTPEGIDTQTLEQPSIAQDASRCPGAGRSQGCVLCGNKGECIFCLAKQGESVEEAMVECTAVEEAGLGCENKEAGEESEPEAVPEENAIGGRERLGDDCPRPLATQTRMTDKEKMRQRKLTKLAARKSRRRKLAGDPTMRADTVSMEQN